MRTTLLLLAMGMAGAAEQPKPTPALNTAELIALNSIELRMKAIRDEYEALDKQRAAVRADACRRALDTPTCEIRPDGTLSKPEPAKPEVKK